MLQEAEALELRLERDQATAQAGRLSKYLQELFEADPEKIPASYGNPLSSAWQQHLEQNTDRLLMLALGKHGAATPCV